MNKSFSLRSALLAGLTGTVAMTGIMYGWPLFGLPRMDIMSALGNVFPLDISPYVMGSFIHFRIAVLDPAPCSGHWQAERNQWTLPLIIHVLVYR